MEIIELIKIVDRYYPPNVNLASAELRSHALFINLAKVCTQANANQEQWKLLLTNIKNNFNIEVSEFILLPEVNPSFIAVFQTGEYLKDNGNSYQPMQLILKISVIAPVYSLYFDNLVAESNKRLIKSNPTTEKETLLFNYIRELMKQFDTDYEQLDMSMLYYQLPHLEDISKKNKRKPYLDECIFGIYLSIHPHNIHEDKYERVILK
ncbi:MAG TPA: hypothetical protein VGC01_09950 [Mucilaginibacter sp.]